jgi:hypothetical protein
VRRVPILAMKMLKAWPVLASALNRQLDRCGCANCIFALTSVSDAGQLNGGLLLLVERMFWIASEVIDKPTEALFG